MGQDTMIAPMQTEDPRSGTNEGAIEVCGANLLQELPDDVLALVSKALQPRDLCNLSMSCKKLNALSSSDKVWWPQCAQVTEIGTDNLQAWRNAVSSYKVLCRFIVSVKPLIGIWVHQNPELGNMVYVMWGFLSVVGCRIIPQELGPLGFDSGLLWAPVFEVIGNSDGSLAFFLHGREREKDYCYPGSLKPAKDDCNVLLLEAEPNRRFTRKQNHPQILDEQSKSSSPENSSSSVCEESSRRVSRSGPRDLKLQKSNDTESIQFSRMGFGDRRRLLELVAHRVRLKVPPFASNPVFPRARHATSGQVNDSSLAKESMQNDLSLLSERRSLLIWMYKHGDPSGKKPNSGSHCDGIQSESALRILCNVSDSKEMRVTKDRAGLDSPKGKNILEGGATRDVPNGNVPSQPAKKQSFAKLVKDRMKHIIGMSSGLQDSEKGNSSTSGDNKRVQLQDFLRLGDTVGLCLHASSLKLAMYRAWPIMHDNRFALYKMPEQKPDKGREYAGLWVGTFGWPPGRPSEDKPGKALFFLLLSYEETEEGLLLIATKILEGTHYVLHPNGSAMFIAKVNEPSSERFPWETDRDAAPVEIVHAYQGEGIANGYGFRYPGSKPGDLFVSWKGLLAFVWRESKAVLTLQRLDVQTLLKNGERVAALPPVANFAYLTKSYSNVFAGYCGLTSPGSLPKAISSPRDKAP
eukprot:Gb_07838 [translate_table: standard]